MRGKRKDEVENIGHQRGGKRDRERLREKRV